MKAFLAWAQQPSSVAGISAVFGTIAAVLSHQITWAQAMPLLAGAFVSIALPDNTVAKDDATLLSRAIVTKLQVSQ